MIWFSGNSRISYLTIRYTELDWNNGTGTSSGAVTRAFDAGVAPNDHVTFSHCYAHESSGYQFYVLQSSDMTVEQCYFYRNGGGGGPDAHWETFWFTNCDNLTLHWSCG